MAESYEKLSPGVLMNFRLCRTLRVYQAKDKGDILTLGIGELQMRKMVNESFSIH